MRLVTFTHDGRTRIGHISSDQILDFSSASADLPTEMVEFLEGGKRAMAVARSIVDAGGDRIRLRDVQLEAPILRPPKILSVGLNYTAHAEECDVDMPEVPVVFNKQTSAVNRPYGDIFLPPESEQLDYEGELGVVIGKRCRRTMVYGQILGYALSNWARDRDTR